MFYFYILKCKDGMLYSGSTKDLKEREVKHNSGRGSKYVFAHGGGKIVYSERFRSWGKTLKREAEVKKWPRIKKLKLIKIKVPPPQAAGYYCKDISADSRQAARY